MPIGDKSFVLNVLHRCLKFQQKVAVPGQKPLATHCPSSHLHVHVMTHIGVNPDELGVEGRVRARIHGRNDLKKKVLLVSSKFKGALTVGHDDVSFKCLAPVLGQELMMSSLHSTTATGHGTSYLFVKRHYKATTRR